MAYNLLKPELILSQVPHTLYRETPSSSQPLRAVSTESRSADTTTPTFNPDTSNSHSPKNTSTCSGPIDVNKKCALLWLPTELLTATLSELDNPTERWMLVEVCLVCRELREIAQSILFGSFMIPEREKSARGALYRLEGFTMAILGRHHSKPVSNLSIRLNRMSLRRTAR